MNNRIYRSVEDHLAFGVCGTLGGIKTHLSFISMGEIWRLAYELELKQSDNFDVLAREMWAVKKGRKNAK